MPKTPPNRYANLLLSPRRRGQVVVSRKSENGEKAVAQIQAAGETSVDVKFIACDLGNLKEVRSVAEQIKKDEGRLDILVAAAGVGVNKFDETKDGIDRHLGVNHLGHFLLINRLLPLMIERFDVGNFEVSRINQIFGRPKSLQLEHPKKRMNRKTSPRTAFTHVPRSPTSFSLAGLSTSISWLWPPTQDQFKETYGEVLGSVLKLVTVPFMKDPNQGSASTVWAAVSREVDGSDGGGGRNKWQGNPTAQASNDESANNLWRLSEELIREKLESDALFKWGA
ncbi:hypothetical protein CCMSSC00406_0009273 [Pleurotus cornucopiae]|uniref:Uncharacterized protein n=1 Tax=Pleurotus cornucopiae TaxID=5321 RepID=A0ACB7IYR7_PLECO|nr:hypothetical protein CCMSSC00406_0009273 [Pleurotus cornucopiae]